MINSELHFKAQYADTDAYKVVWHGNYLRWMEAGRVDFLYLNGVDIKKLDEEQDIVMPVVEVNIKYKQSAKLLDDVTVKTSALEVTNLYILFEQVIIDKNTEKVLTTATVKGVAIKNGRVLRNLKEILGQV